MRQKTSSQCKLSLTRRNKGLQKTTNRVWTWLIKMTYADVSRYIGYAIMQYLKVDCDPCDHNVNFENQEVEMRGSELSQIRDKAMNWQKERKACERKWGWEKERGKVRARPNLSDNLQIPHKGKGTSETAGALGNNTLLSFSFTSGPKRTWKPTTHRQNITLLLLLSANVENKGLRFLSANPSSTSKKETNKTGTHLKKKCL